MTADVASRIPRVQAAMAEAGVSGLVVTPGSDLRYLTGYDAKPLERLTALIVPAEGDPRLVVPLLEVAEAERSPAALAGMQVVTHGETDDAYAVALHALQIGGRRWPSTTTCGRRASSALQQALPRGTAAGRWSPDRRPAACARAATRSRRCARPAPRSTACTSGWGSSSRSAAPSARRLALIAEAIIDEGHATTDFVIVGSGPNGASPHHAVSDRVIERGDTVVIDIGGSTVDGYCRDSTRTYVVGAEPAGDVHALLRRPARGAARPMRLRPARGDGRGGRPGRASGDHRRGLRRQLHAPHGPRHRARDPRGAVHRRGQPAGPRARHGVLDRARHLPAGPARCPDRGHRRHDRGRHRATEHDHARTSRCWRADGAACDGECGPADLPAAGRRRPDVVHRARQEDQAVDVGGAPAGQAAGAARRDQGLRRQRSTSPRSACR